MKHFFSGMMIALALVLSLVIGVVALAENPEAEAPELPSAEALQPAQDAQQPSGEASTDDTALQEALDAYRAAKQSGQQDSLEAELKGFVESGKLTQAQADLILNAYKEQQSLRDGVCPNCGYQFRNGYGRGKGDRGMKGRGMNGGMGGRGMNGGMFGRGMFNQQPAGGQADGMSFQSDAQAVPFMDGTEGI